jgi:hypothetical protein
MDYTGQFYNRRRTLGYGAIGVSGFIAMILVAVCATAFAGTGSPVPWVCAMLACLVIAMCGLTRVVLGPYGR